MGTQISKITHLFIFQRRHNIYFQLADSDSVFVKLNQNINKYYAMTHSSNLIHSDDGPFQVQCSVLSHTMVMMMPALSSFLFQTSWLGYYQLVISIKSSMKKTCNSSINHCHPHFKVLSEIESNHCHH